MGFLTPLLLLGAAATAIPIAIHLFFRSRYRTVPWAAMRFLLTSVEQTSRRLKIQEYILLLSRIAVLTFLAIALARPINFSPIGCVYLVLAVLFTIVTATWALAPFWKIASTWGGNFASYLVSQAFLLGLCCFGWYLFVDVLPVGTDAQARGRGDAVDAAFVFDVSFSMAANDGAKSRLERAREEAVKIIDELPPLSTVQIITCAENRKVLLGPRSPASLDQAKLLLQDLEITHLASDLYPGVDEAKEVLQRGQASNKELYVFSDMQKQAFDQQAGELKETLQDLKQKTLVHFVRCGAENRSLKNVAIVGITPQTGLPRPGERVGFAVLMRNTTSEEIENLTVSLAVDGDEKNLETTSIAKLPPRETRAVALAVKFEQAGARVLTARVKHDDLDADNRFDMVVQVQDQVNILVVDGNLKETEPEKSSSFFLEKALLPQVKDTDRAGFYLQPRVIPARLAAPALLEKQDLCILVNVSLQARPGPRADVLPTDFLDALDGFVRRGHGLIVFAGDNVQPDVYNKVLGKKLGLLPMPIKSAVKLPIDKMAFINRSTFKDAPPAYWMFKDDKNYEAFDGIIVWQYLDLDETLEPDIEQLRYRYFSQGVRDLADLARPNAGADGKLPRGFFDIASRTQNKDFGFVFDGTLTVPERGQYTFYLEPADGVRLSISGVPLEFTSERKATVELMKGKQDIKLEYVARTAPPRLAVAWSGPGFARRPLSVNTEENPLSVVVRLNNGKPLVTAKKVDAGEVVFVGTAADWPNNYEKTLERTWSIWPRAAKLYIPFVHVSVNYLLRGQSQAYNLVAGQTLKWYPRDAHDRVYNLIHPDLKTVERLKPPEKTGNRVVVTATDLPRAGVYYISSAPRGATNESTEVSDAVKTGTPIAVVFDPRESMDLQTLSSAQIDEQLGFAPIHIIAGDANAVSTGVERLNREWTILALFAVLLLALGETALAWWCGRSW